MKGFPNQISDLKKLSAAMRVSGLCSNDTVYLSYLDPTPSADPVGNPVGAWWLEVAPDYGQYRYITGWWDDGNGYLDSLHYVAIADSLVRSALLCRVEEVTIGMISDPLRVSDANSSGEEDIDDVVYIISYIFTGGPAPTPCPVTSGDADCSCEIDVDDVVYAIEYIFLGGSAPCQCDEWITGCSHLCY